MASATGQDLPTEIWTVRHDNQVGRFADAAQRAERLLAADAGSIQQRCDLWLHLAFARSRLEREDAAEAFAAFEESADELPGDDRLRLEMAMLRESLELPPREGLAGESRTFQPPVSDSYWRSSATGLDPPTRDALVSLARRSGTDGLLVARSGEILFEHYSPLYREPMPTMSSTKSITALLAGILVDRGALAVTDLVGDFVPTWQAGPRADVTVRHLLTMTAGLQRRSPLPRQSGESWNEYAVRQPLAHAPGTRWEYTNEGAQLLSPILEQAAAMPLAEFAEQVLFEPIGATATAMRSNRGSTNTYADAGSTLREFARFGELVRRRGTWPGVGRVLSEEWIEAMLEPCGENPGYGYLWWLEGDGRGYAMRGYLDTNVWVYPELGMVVARMQRRAYLHVREPFDADRLYTLLAR